MNTDSTTETYITTSATDIYLNANISNMFNNCQKLKLNLDTLNWKYDLVTNMSNAYYNCLNLAGSPVCGPNVTDMSYTYNGCSNLSGSPVCGNNVTNMSDAYSSCINLTGAPVCGPNVTNMASAYYNCNKLYGNMNISNFVTVDSSNLRTVVNMFYNRNTRRRLNIFVPAGTNNIFNILRNANSTSNGSITGTSFTWALNLSYDYFYNATVNIYVYGGNASVRPA